MSSGQSSPGPSKGFKLSLGGSKPKPSPLSKKPLVASSALNGAKKRAYESDSEDDEPAKVTAQAVTGFDHSAGGAITIGGPAKEKERLVIPKQANKNWREESQKKRGKNLLPAEVQAARNGAVPVPEGDDVVNGAPQGYGLTFAKKDEQGDVVMSQTAVQTSDGPSMEPPKAKTDDELAMEALTGTNTKKSNLVLPAIGGQAEDEDWRNRNPNISENDAYRNDVASRPDQASLDDYAAVPVEEFGAALLRGMGWKEGDVVGKRKDQISKPRVVERRPNLLGIGAKEVPGGVEEFGAWGKGGKKKGYDREKDKVYNPVMLRNSATGELITEDELKKKKEEDANPSQKTAKDEKDWRDRRDRNLEGRTTSRIEGSDKTKYDDKDRRDRPRERERERDRDRVPRDRHTDSRDRERRSYDYDRRDREKGSRRTSRDRESDRSSKRYKDDDSSRRRDERDRDYSRDKGSSRKEHESSSRSGGSYRDRDRRDGDYKSSRREKIY
jgi:G-patch domain